MATSEKEIMKAEQGVPPLRAASGARVNADVGRRKAMKKSILVLFGLAIASWASEGPWMVADNLVDISDHILTATVTNVVIPGGSNLLESDYVGMGTRHPIIRMELMVLTNEMLKTTAPELPNSIIIEASCPGIGSLATIRSYYLGKTSLFFLKGDQFSPVFEDDPEFPGTMRIWMQDLSNKPEILEAIEKEKAQQGGPGYPPQGVGSPER